MNMSDYALKFTQFENGRGFIVVRSSDDQRLDWRSLPRSDGLESLNVVGEQFYVPAIEHESFAVGLPVTLVREPDNRFDSNAIAVFNADRSHQVGYLPRDDARRLSRAFVKNGVPKTFAIWETFSEEGRRVALRLLLVKDSASIDLGPLQEAH